MALIYRWILVGHTACQSGVTHSYTLYDNKEQFTSLVACRISSRQFVRTDTIYSELEYTTRILCQPPVIGGLMPYAYEGLEAGQSDEGDDSSAESEDSDNSIDITKPLAESEDSDNSIDITKPWIRWELYRKARCGNDSHYILHRANHQLNLNMMECIYEFSEYFVTEVCCYQPQWRLHIYCM